jgi:hypothetical protein
MVKKKLTKAQVKRKIKLMHNACYDLVLDKLGYGTASYSPMSKDKLMSIMNDLDRARVRMK